MRILLVEDDSETAEYVAAGLRQEGFVVDHAPDGLDGLHIATESPPDLMIIDRMLPRLDGVSMLKAARAAGVNAPALFLTALGTVDDRVEGIDAVGFKEPVAGVGVGVWLVRRPRTPLFKAVETLGYHTNPFEWWAYSRDDYWPPNGKVEGLGWTRPIVRPLSAARAAKDARRRRNRRAPDDGSMTVENI